MKKTFRMKEEAEEAFDAWFNGTKDTIAMVRDEYTRKVLYKELEETKTAYHRAFLEGFKAGVMA